MELIEMLLVVCPLVFFAVFGGDLLLKMVKITPELKPTMRVSALNTREMSRLEAPMG